MTVYVETHGSGPDVVLLHGWAANLQYMKLLADHLGKNFRVTNVNLPGRGGSDWDNISSVDDMADRILAVVPESAIYIGWSIGGLIAASIAARFPERVERIIGIATTPNFVEDGDWPGLPKPGFKAAFDMQTNAEFKAAMVEMLQAEFEAFPALAKQRDHLLALNDASDLDISVCLEGIGIVDISDFRPQYRQLTCPVDLILGESDPFVPASSYPMIRALNDRIEIHPIASAKHILLWTHAQQLQDMVDALLCGVPA
jgi:pimeloyl-[acyl-carrier protein] methyl ester esterase